LKRSNRLVLLIGIFLAIVAFVLVVLTLQGGGSGGGQSQTDPGLREVTVVVAAKDIPLGSRIQADMVTTQVVKQADKPADSYVNTSEVIGQTARQPVTSGQLISSAVLGTTGGSIQQIDCPAGLVCIAVQVDQVSGVGTLTKAGDYVDMIVGFTADRFPVVTVNPDDDTITTVVGLNGTSVKALLQGLQVVGTLLPPPPADTGNNAEASPGTDGTSTVLNGQQQIVILAATTQQAEVIKFGQMDGSISIVLRSGDDFRDPTTGEPLPPETIIPVTTTGITLKSLVDDYGVLVPELVEAILPEQAAAP
jgi:Flp pilus assembly protein CpaB